MTLSSLIGGIASNSLKVHPLNNLNKLLTSKNPIFLRRVHYNHRIPSNVSSIKNSSLLDGYTGRLTHVVNTFKRFSTSSSLLNANKHHDHSKIWGFERVLSALLLPVLPAALMYPGRELDTVLALLVVMHTHFGLEAIIVDYIRPILFGNVVPKIGIALLYVFSILTFAGLLNLIYNDAGLANTILNIWKK